MMFYWGHTDVGFPVIGYVGVCLYVVGHLSLYRVGLGLRCQQYKDCIDIIFQIRFILCACEGHDGEGIMGEQVLKKKNKVNPKNYDKIALRLIVDTMY